jgi:crotonobetainyl-CoA:carnitine CoA-transferase CaiB-like acyl-CoA transferase
MVHKEIEEMERLARSHAIARRAKRDAERKAYYERKRAAEAKSALQPADAPVDAPTSTPAEGSRQPQEKDILHLKTSSGNKIAKSDWTAINHRK